MATQIPFPIFCRRKSGTAAKEGHAVKASRIAQADLDLGVTLPTYHAGLVELCKVG